MPFVVAVAFVAVLGIVLLSVDEGCCGPCGVFVVASGDDAGGAVDAGAGSLARMGMTIICLLPVLNFIGVSGSMMWMVLIPKPSALLKKSLFRNIVTGAPFTVTPSTSRLVHLLSFAPLPRNTSFLPSTTKPMGLLMMSWHGIRGMRARMVSMAARDNYRIPSGKPLLCAES